MRFTVLGFNQQMAVQYDLSVNDLLLLQYIMQANGVPEMKHITDDDECSYVWLSHSKISEDLPILGYTEGTLKNKLSELKKKGLIQSIQVPLQTGSKTYYSVTSLTTSFINDVGRNFKMTSNNILNNKENTISKDIVFSDEEPKNEKPKKKNLYQQCLDMINDFTNDSKLRELLIMYLDLVLEKYRHEGKTLYANQFKGMLNKLDQVCTDGKYGAVVQQSLDHQYVSFFPVNTYSKPKTYVPDTNKAPQHKAGEKARNDDGTLKEY